MKKKINWFQVLIILIISFSFISCKTSKNASNDEKIETEKVSEIKTNEVIVDDKLIGVVEKNKECGFVIRVKTDKDEQIYLPDNLETILQIENIRVKFSFEAISQKSKCEVMKPIHLTYITRLR